MALNVGENLFTQCPLRPYLPTPPPEKTTKSRGTFITPLYALNGYKNEAEPILIEKAMLPHHSNRNRLQVGGTNRWHLSTYLGGDLLGTSQALKAVQKACTTTIRNVKTADNPRGKVSDSDVSLLEMLRIPVHQRYKWVRYTHPLMRTKSAPQEQPRTQDLDELIFLPRVESCIATGQHRSNQRPLGSPSCQRTPKRDPNRKVHPSPNPVERYIMLFQQEAVSSPPDILLHALNMNWFLHSYRILASGVLSALLEDATQSSSDVRTSEPINNKGAASPLCLESGISLSIPTFSASCLVKERLTHLTLKVNDRNVTKHAFATALLSLYEEETPLDIRWIVEVTAAAALLRMHLLLHRCSNIMTEAMSKQTVSDYYAASKKYSLTDLASACENWMTLNLVTQLSHDVALTDVPLELLTKTLKCPRLFSPNEYAIYKVICTWLFLREYKTATTLPSWDTIVTWFISFSNQGRSFRSEQSQVASRLFSTLRLNGITESVQLEELQKMGLIPAENILQMLSNHYYALQRGGDMSLLTKYKAGAVRYGFILEEESTSFSKVISLHGFTFQLCADVNDFGVVTIYFRRLKPGDNLLPYRICQRTPFSMREDREVRYTISVQWLEHQLFCIETIGPISECFGFGSRNAESKALNLQKPSSTLHIMYNIFLPPS